MNLKEFDEWYLEAQNDFEVGKILIKSRKFNSAAFHFDQSAEKGVKALLYLLNQKPWGHSITLLLDEYEKLGYIINLNVRNAAISLESHYFTSRYPDSLPNINIKDYYDKKLVEELKDNSNLILKFVYDEKEVKMNYGKSTRP
jgi:HEPN domain-containing protein